MVESVVDATFEEGRNWACLVESERSLEIGLLLDFKPAHFVLELIALLEPLPVPTAIPGEPSSFRWALRTAAQVDVPCQRHEFRTAPIHCSNVKEARRRFEDFRRDFCRQPLVQWMELRSPMEEDVLFAKWKVVQDWHRSSMALFNGTEWASLTEDEATRRAGEVQRQFSIELHAKLGITLPPVEQLSSTQRKSYARRKSHLNRPARELAQYYQKKSYLQLRPKQLAAALKKATGCEVTPEAAKMLRKRLGLTSGYPEGRPPGS